MQAAVLLSDDALLPPFDHVPSSVAIPLQQVHDDLQLALALAQQLQSRSGYSAAAAAEVAWLQRTADGIQHIPETDTARKPGPCLPIAANLSSCRPV